MKIFTESEEIIYKLRELYEKYGYRYVKDIVNYGGGTDRLYAKDLI